MELKAQSSIVDDIYAHVIVDLLKPREEITSTDLDHAIDAAMRELSRQQFMFAQRSIKARVIGSAYHVIVERSKY